MQHGQQPVHPGGDFRGIGLAVPHFDQHALQVGKIHRRTRLPVLASTECHVHHTGDPARQFALHVLVVTHRMEHRADFLRIYPKQGDTVRRSAGALVLNLLQLGHVILQLFCLDLRGSGISRARPYHRKDLGQIASG